MGVLPINYIEFASGDFDASRNFFENAFGWRFTHYGVDYAGIEDAGLDGGIARAENGHREPLVILYASDLDAAEAAVRDAGGEITLEQYDFPGGRRFHFREPGGNELAVWGRPSA